MSDSEKNCVVKYYYLHNKNRVFPTAPMTRQQALDAADSLNVKHSRDMYHWVETLDGQTVEREPSNLDMDTTIPRPTRMISDSILQSEIARETPLKMAPDNLSKD